MLTPNIHPKEIELVQSYCSKDTIMLEYGCGGSTTIFPRYVKKYYSIEHNLDWFWNENIYIELLKISGGLNRIIHYRNMIGSELSDNLCTDLQTRKRFHYKQLIKSGKINVRDGVIRLIEELARDDIEQIIVTTSGRDSLEPFLHTSLQSQKKFFSEIITYENVTNHKPFPDAYNLAIEKSKMPKDNCIVIEDSKIGIDAAKAANLNCLFKCSMRCNLSVTLLSIFIHSCIYLSHNTFQSYITSNSIHYVKNEKKL